MIDWIDANDELPQDGEWVLGYFPDMPWGAGDEKWRHKCSVVRFVRGLSIEGRGNHPDRERARYHHSEDEGSNNKRPFNWQTFGAMSMFGQECAKWARLEMEVEA
jgi:hypothetical protein